MRMNICRSMWSLFVCLLLVFTTHAYSMARPPAEPIPLVFFRAAYEQDASAVVVEFVVPDASVIEDLSRLEMLICDANGKAIFGAMQNLDDRCDPVPPGAFGVVVDPLSDDRSIKNVSSAGINGQWDQASPQGTLLKQSVSGIVNGDLGISFWIIPQDWSPGSYVVKVRSVRAKHSPSPWQKLATFSYTGKDVEDVVQSQCLVKPVFVRAWEEVVIPSDHVLNVTLIRYERQPQDKGVEIKRWAGDTSGQYKYVEIEAKKLKLSDFPDGRIPLEPGLYQFKHNSVYGQPPSGYYGESAFFEIKPGQESIEVQVPLNAAI